MRGITDFGYLGTQWWHKTVYMMLSDLDSTDLRSKDRLFVSFIFYFFANHTASKSDLKQRNKIRSQSLSYSWAFSLPCKQTDMSPLLKSLPPNHECNSCTKWSFGLFHSNIIISARLLIRLQSSMSKDFLQSLYLDWLNGNTFLWHIGPIQYWFIC